MPLLAALALALGACHHADDERIPRQGVNLRIDQGQWNTYGIGGAGQAVIFDREKGLPAGYPFAALDETGYAGILLVYDVNGTLLAFSPACPVERSANTVVQLADYEGTPSAVCPVCGSVFDIFVNRGVSVAGEANKKGYSLTPYTVSATQWYPVVVSP